MSLEQFLYIPADPAKKARLELIDPDKLLDDLHSLIDCNTVEFCYTNFRQYRLAFCIDECGKIRKPLKPLNFRATLLYYNPHDYLAGDVVVGLLSVRDGEADIVGFLIISCMNCVNYLMTLMNLLLYILDYLSLICSCLALLATVSLSLLYTIDLITLLLINFNIFNLLMEVEKMKLCGYSQIDVEKENKTTHGIMCYRQIPLVRQGEQGYKSDGLFISDQLLKALGLSRADIIDAYVGQFDISFEMTVDGSYTNVVGIRIWAS